MKILIIGLRCRQICVSFSLFIFLSKHSNSIVNSWTFWRWVLLYYCPSDSKSDFKVTGKTARCCVPKGVA